MAVVILHVHKYKKKVTRKFNEKHVVATWEPTHHSLVDTGKPRKTCVEVAGHRTFRILTSSQLSGIQSKNSNIYIVQQIHIRYNNTRKTNTVNKKTYNKVSL